MDIKKFTELQTQYKRTLQEKVTEAKRLVQNLKSHYNKEDLVALRFLVHKLAGNASLFGFPKVSEMCLLWDTKLRESCEVFPAPSPHDLDALLLAFESAL